MSEPEPPREEEDDDEETGAYQLSPAEERPVTLDPLTEIPSLEPLPEDMTTQEALAPDEVTIGTEEEEVSGPPLPTLLPLNLDGVFLWPFQGGHLLLMTAVFLLILLGCIAGHWLGSIPILGTVLRIGLLLVIAVLTLPYVLRATLASIAGAHLPPPWPSWGTEASTHAEGVRMLLLLGLHILPGVAAHYLFGWIPALVLVLLGWILYPGALLLLAASGRLGFTHPFESGRIAAAGGIRYVFCTLPGWFVLVCRVFTGSTVVAPAFEAFGFFALVWTGFMVGRLPHECGAISDRLLAISTRMEEEEREEIERWKDELSRREDESEGGAETAPPSDEPED